MQGNNLSQTQERTVWSLVSMKDKLLPWRTLVLYTLPTVEARIWTNRLRFISFLDRLLLWSKEEDYLYSGDQEISNNVFLWWNYQTPGDPCFSWIISFSMKDKILAFNFMLGITFHRSKKPKNKLYYTVKQIRAIPKESNWRLKGSHYIVAAALDLTAGANRFGLHLTILRQVSESISNAAFLIATRNCCWFLFCLLSFYSALIICD